MVTEAAMQQVKEPHARLPRDQERRATVRVGRGQGTHSPTHIHPHPMAVSSGPHPEQMLHRRHSSLLGGKKTASHPVPGTGIRKATHCIGRMSGGQGRGRSRREQPCKGTEA